MAFGIRNTVSFNYIFQSLLLFFRNLSGADPQEDGGCAGQPTGLLWVVTSPEIRPVNLYVFTGVCHSGQNWEGSSSSHHALLVTWLGRGLPTEGVLRSYGFCPLRGGGAAPPHQVMILQDMVTEFFLNCLNFEFTLFSWSLLFQHRHLNFFSTRTGKTKNHLMKLGFSPWTEVWAVWVIPVQHAISECTEGGPVMFPG